MMSSLQLSLPPSWNHLSRRHQPPPSPRPRISLPRCAALSKQGHRFLSSVAATVDSPADSYRLIRKFIASSSKHVALTTLAHLLCPSTSHPRLSFLALPLYLIISEAPWFNWNPKLVADVIALLYKQERLNEAETLISETISKLGFKERQLCTFYCNLIESHSKHKSKQGVLDSQSLVKQLISHSSSVYVKRQAYGSVVNGLCEIGLPREAESLVEEMTSLGFKPSVFEFRSIVYAYGRLGLFEDMKRSVVQVQNEGFGLDTVCCNMVLSSFGAHNELPEMVLWVQRMKDSRVSLSIRTYNSVLNSCATVMSVVQEPKSVPLSVKELMENMCIDESNLVQELMGKSVLDEAMECSSSELKLDLHGMHLGSAYLIILLWFDEMRSRFHAQDQMIPAEVTVVCGSGKHSSTRGESPVKDLVKEMMVRMKCPMRIDRNNTGCFIAKGKVLKEWLCSTLP